MTSARQRLGHTGEQLAADFLSQRGLAIVDRNWRCTGVGEIDLVARDGDCLVIVEVRTRRGVSYGTPAESVTPAKQARLAMLAEAYCQETAWAGPLRIDVVAVTLAASGRLLEIDHIHDAVDG